MRTLEKTVKPHLLRFRFYAFWYSCLVQRSSTAAWNDSKSKFRHFILEEYPTKVTSASGGLGFLEGDYPGTEENKAAFHFAAISVVFRSNLKF